MERRQYLQGEILTTDTTNLAVVRFVDEVLDENPAVITLELLTMDKYLQKVFSMKLIFLAGLELVLV